MSEIKEKPFDMGYVLGLTAKKMRIAIDTSIRKTFDRLEEFANDEAKSRELFKTLGLLHGMRKDLDDFQLRNINAFKGEV